MNQMWFFNVIIYPCVHGKLYAHKPMSCSNIPPYSLKWSLSKSLELGCWTRVSAPPLLASTVLGWQAQVQPHPAFSTVLSI